jgi:hypothetical protein
LLGDLELHRPARLFLDHGGAVPHLAADTYVVDLQPHEVAAPQLAVDGKIEQDKVAPAALQL